jgi:hypothetical protein
MASPLRQVRIAQRSSKVQSHATICLEQLVPKLRRHKRIMPRTKMMACIRTDTESRKISREAPPDIPSVSFPRHELCADTHQKASDDVYWSSDSFEEYEGWYCRPWWDWVPSFKDGKKNGPGDNQPGFGIDLQALNVLNQSPGGQRPFFSLDLSANALAKNWDFSKNEICSTPTEKLCLAVLHEPGLGVTASLHFRESGDMTDAPAQTREVAIHPLLTAQTDLLNLSIERKEGVFSGLELKLTIAPQLDLYGRFTGKNAQFQLPLQPNVEWHLCKGFSAVFQVSISLFTVGGRNSPPSFAIGILWHAKD